MRHIENVIAVLLISGIFVFAYLTKTEAKSNEFSISKLKEQTLIRMFNEIEATETKLGRSFLIHIMTNSNDPLPVLTWNSDVDYYLLYPNGYPSVSPHTSEIHFDLKEHLLDTDIAIYKGRVISHQLSPYMRPCIICEKLLSNDK